MTSIGNSHINSVKTNKWKTSVGMSLSGYDYTFAQKPLSEILPISYIKIHDCIKRGKKSFLRNLLFPNSGVTL